MTRRDRVVRRSWKTGAVSAALAFVAVSLTTLSSPAASAAAPSGIGTATPEQTCTTNTRGISPVLDATWGPDGNFWWIENPVAAIGRRTPEGVVTHFYKGLRDDDVLTTITVGPDGNLWFVASSVLTKRIGRITPAGVITMFDQGFTAGSRPRDITTGPDGNLWFTDTQKKQVGRITPAGVITMFPFDPTGTLPNAQGSVAIVTGPDGALYFTTQGAIGRITTAGTVTLFTAGLTIERENGTPLGDVLNGPELGIAVGPDGQLWFTRLGSSELDEAHPPSISRMTTAGVVTKVADIPLGVGVNGDLQQSSLLDLLTGPDGNVWVGDALASRIGKVTPAGQVTMFKLFSRDLAGNDTVAPANPTGLSVGPDGAIWYGESSASGIAFGVPGGVGRITTAGVGGTVPLSTPLHAKTIYQVGAGPDGLLWYTDQYALNKVSSDGQVTRIPGTLGAYSFAVAANKDVWFPKPGAVASTSSLARLSPDGTITTFSAGLPLDFKPASIVLGGDGNFWFFDGDQPRIGRITPQGVITVFSTGIRSDAVINDIIAGPDGNVWFAEGANNRLGRITPAGSVTEFEAGPADPFDLAGTVGLAAGPDGNVWFSGGYGNQDGTEFTGQIGKITPTGVMTKYTDGFTGAPGTLRQPLGITSAEGSLWVGFLSEPEIVRVSTNGQITGHFPTTGENIAAAGFSQPVRLGESYPARFGSTPDGSLWWADQTPIIAFSRLTVRDSIGDPCNPDEDGDLLKDTEDPAPFNPDVDGDGKKDGSDNCVQVANSDQADLDGDKLGDACDPDIDGDNVVNTSDNCVRTPNADQADADHDGTGDACDPTKVCATVVTSLAGYHVVVGTSKPETLTGTAGADLIYGLGAADTINGLGGNDILCGGDAADTINGGAGNDAILGGDASDTINGNDGDDQIKGAAGPDKLYGGAGIDRIDGGQGNDTIDGGDGNDSLVGGTEQDTITGGNGDDVLEGNAGNDTLSGGAGFDRGIDPDKNTVRSSIEATS